MSEGHVFIVGAARTPIGNFNGALSTLKASELGSVVIKEVLKRSGVNGDEVNEVIMGQALSAGQGQNTARQASLNAGVPYDVPAYTVNMLCGSGIKTVVLGFQSIRNGDSDVVICGGQESMSQAPHAIHLRQGVKMGNGSLIDTLLHDGLTDATENIHMGVTAENLAAAYNISRESQDEYAVRSQNLAETAQKSGFFDEEIVSVEIINRKTKIIVDKDEYIKNDTKLEALQKLRPCFLNNGSVTAGNSSGINDSAAAVLLMSAEAMQKRNVKPLARIVAWAQTGVDPKVMGIGPVTAVQAVLRKANWTKEEVDLFELNEAFAAQSLAVLKCLDLDPSKVNINGGAIALGHPLGASGNRILVTLLFALKRTGKKKGVASLCVGGGMGIALAVELV